MYWYLALPKILQKPTKRKGTRMKKYSVEVQFTNVSKLTGLELEYKHHEHEIIEADNPLDALLSFNLKHTKNGVFKDNPTMEVVGIHLYHNYDSPKSSDTAGSNVVSDTL